MPKTTLLHTITFTVFAIIANHVEAQRIFWESTPGISGTITNDLYITASTSANADGSVGVAELLVDLDAPTKIHQDPFGSVVPPNGAVVNIFPDLAFDTFLASGSMTSPGTFGEPLIVGGAVDIGGDAPLTFSQDRIDAAWAPRPGNILPVVPAAFLARVTLADDATGSATVLSSIIRSSAVSPQFTVAEFAVVNGVIVPEPQLTWTALGIALLCLTAWHRCR